MRRWLTHNTIIITALLIAVAPVLFYGQSGAAELVTRKVSIGSSVASATTPHDFSFVLGTAANLGSIVFEYCSNSPLIDSSCTQPNGLSLSGATLDAQTGATGFSIHPSSTVNRLVISRPPAPNLAGQSATYDFGSVVNPSDNTTVFVKISTYVADDGTGPRTDNGSVAFATTPRISIEAYVPPYLTFCAAITISNRCLSTAGNFMSLGELSKTDYNYSTSQFGGATNDPGGYSVFLSGNTMASGTNTIPALASQQPASPGTSQFGLNLVANSSPGFGANPSGSGSIAVNNEYDNANRYKFNNQIIASTPNSTNFNTVTVSYMVNVSQSQKPGVYTTTLTYIATAAF